MTAFKTPFVLLSFLAIIATVNAQEQFPCGTRDEALLERLTGNDPEILARIAQSEAELEAFTAEFIASGQAGGERAAFTIPVVFHIIHELGPENIPDANIHDAVRILNEDFNKENPDWSNVRPEFLGIVADVDVEFALARKDPQGNCTNGITRTVSHLTNNGETAMKALIQWPRNKYLNVWVCANAGGPGVAGYTMTPGTAQWFPAEDGIVMRYNYVGSLSPSSPGNSRTLTHEVGHWINLEHTWGPTNQPAVASNCNFDDGVADTPNTVGWTSCNLNGSTCDGTLDNVENFMEYAFCDKMFTNGQKARMHAALNSSTAQRNQLWTTANLAATGVTGTPQLCAAVFVPGPQDICAGGTVSFSDQSYHGVTGRTWSFPGGVPATSTEVNPTITYNTPGVYAVSLTVTNGPDQVSSTAEGLITVQEATGVAVPLTEGFDEYMNIASSPWRVENPHGNNTFEITDAASYSGTKSVRILNLPSMLGQTDALISGIYDLEGVGSILIDYRYAYARRTASSNDRLRFFVSSNCGETWSLRQQLIGSSNLNTAGAPMTGNFVPGEDQWGHAEVTNIGTLFQVSDFRFKFEFESAGGNNLYIDHINLNGGNVGLDELEYVGAGMLVMPNPASGPANVMLHMAQPDRVALAVHDPAGREVAMVHAGHLAVGSHRLPLHTDRLAAGLYLLTLRRSDRTETIRFVVEHSGR